MPARPPYGFLHHLPRTLKVIMEMGMLIIEINTTKNDIMRQSTTFLLEILTTDLVPRKFITSGYRWN